MNDQSLKVNVSPDKIEARYSDFAIVSQNGLGFNFDFGQRMPNKKEVNIVGRVALSPQHAKLFSKLLAENVKKYEEKFGEIKLPRDKGQKVEDPSKILHFR